MKDERERSYLGTLNSSMRQIKKTLVEIEERSGIKE